MSDVTQGQDAPDDASLFSDATTTTLEKFENAEPLKPEPKPPEPKAAEVKEPPKPEAPEAPVPAGRLREESERARRAERERDDLLRQLATRPQAPQQPVAKPDLFENPDKYIQHQVGPYFEQIQAQMRMQAEAFSEQMAGSAFGQEKVSAAKQALTEGMHRGDPDVKAVWQRAMESAHPYDVITRWHLQNENMKEVGGDLTAYKRRVIEEAMKDPSFQRQVIEASKNGATHVVRPVTSSVPRIPSLGSSVGAGGGDSDLQEPSDEQLFRAAVTARRK